MTIRKHPGLGHCAYLEEPALVAGDIAAVLATATAGQGAGSSAAAAPWRLTDAPPGAGNGQPRAVAPAAAASVASTASTGSTIRMATRRLMPVISV